MTTVIDQSETLSALNINALSTTVVEKDAGSPAGPVVVHAGVVNAGALSGLVVQNHATLDANGINLGVAALAVVRNGGLLNISGLLQADVLSTIDIGHNGTLELGSSLAVNILSTIDFIGPGAVLKVAPAAQGPLLTPGASGEITGFGTGDKIDLLKLSGVTHAEWTQNLLQALSDQGTVVLLNAQDQAVGSIVLHGQYATSEFAVASDNHGGTNLTFV